MIILDTNVISALMQSRPDRRIAAWLDGQSATSIWTTSVSVFEVQYGLALLAKGRKRKVLEETFELFLRQDLSERILSFDESAAVAAAEIAARLRTDGKPTEIRDTMIAGIAAAHRAMLATINTRHFINTGVKFVDPTAQSSTGDEQDR